STASQISRANTASASRNLKLSHRLPECRSFCIVPKEVTDLMAGNCAFADDLPAIASMAEIDDGGRDFARCGTAIYDHADALAHLSSHAFRSRAFARACQAGRSGSNGKSKGFHDCHRNARIRQTQRDIARVRRNLQWYARSRFDNHGERSG